MSPETIRAFAAAKLPWIRQQQRKLQAQERETPREYLDRESHHVFGRRCMVTITEEDAPPKVELRHNTLFLRVRPGTTEASRHEVLEEWYRVMLRDAAAPLIARWEPVLGVTVRRVFVQHMKTKWGSCNHKRQTIRLNTELAKKPRECLEYLVVHEMIHLLEPTHDQRFVMLMDESLPHWQYYRQLLNRLPLRHEQWEY
jgi:predicted metal-dependent hydrolase